MHVAALYHGTSGPTFTKVRELVSIGQTSNTAKFRRAPTTGVRDIRCGKNLLTGKVGESSPWVS